MVQEMATPIIVEVSTGVMKPLLCKLSKLLEGVHKEIKFLRDELCAMSATLQFKLKEIKFLRDELCAMSATLQMLAVANAELNPQTRDWRDRLHELAYDVEDCVDAFIARIDNGRPPKGFKEFSRKLKKLKVRHEIANEVEELKRRAMEASLCSVCSLFLRSRKVSARIQSAKLRIPPVSAVQTSMCVFVLHTSLGGISTREHGQLYDVLV